MSKSVSDDFIKGHDDGHSAGKSHQSKDELAKWVEHNDSKSHGSGDYKKGYDKGWNDSYSSGDSSDSSSSSSSSSGK